MQRRSLFFTCLIALFCVLFHSARAAESSQTATFAGGCFWCIQPAFDKVKGVASTTVGYTGGTTVNPSYEAVSAGGTGHMESIQVTYDPEQVTYSDLLYLFWHNVDPTDANGQFCDQGDQYRSAIFYANDEQKDLAERSKQALIDSKKIDHVYTQILPASAFYPAEEYHQDYYLKNPIRYKYYRMRCGRDKRLKEVWGTPAHE